VGDALVGDALVGDALVGDALVGDALVRVVPLRYRAARGFRIVVAIPIRAVPSRRFGAARPASTASRTTLVRAEEGGNAGGERNREVVQP
jgi:hypothetical protein